MEPASTSKPPEGAEDSDADARRRVLVTGVASYWGGRLAQTLEADPSIEAIVGVDSEEPTREFTRTEFVLSLIHI